MYLRLIFDWQPPKKADPKGKGKAAPAKKKEGSSGGKAKKKVILFVVIFHF